VETASFDPIRVRVRVRVRVRLVVESASFDPLEMMEEIPSVTEVKTPKMGFIGVELGLNWG